MTKKKTVEEGHNEENKGVEEAVNKDDNGNLTGSSEEQGNGGNPNGSVLTEEGSSINSGGVHDKVNAEDRTTEDKLAEMQDRYLRLSAEFDNYRKRTLREKLEMSKYAGEEIILKLLPVMDDFERALKSMEETSECQSIKTGLDLIYSKFSDFLIQHGVKEIESLNTGFNVDLHDAVAKLPVNEEDKKGKVVDVVLKGYYLKDKVIRHARVVVGE